MVARPCTNNSTGAGRYIHEFSKGVGQGCEAPGRSHPAQRSGKTRCAKGSMSTKEPKPSPQCPVCPGPTSMQEEDIAYKRDMKSLRSISKVFNSVERLCIWQLTLTGDRAVKMNKASQSL